ncbi:unnamed protein product, partial [Mesorhabditis belari]|uniref:Uncharacterized protein n=1 Tax=Mesorhabditis belari TaxID=2138241 RepID=A0AAF3F9N4_9BILA
MPRAWQAQSIEESYLISSSSNQTFMSMMLFMVLIAISLQALEIFWEFLLILADHVIVVMKFARRIASIQLKTQETFKFLLNSREAI